MQKDVQLQQLHERVLMIMSEVHKVCEENSIHYSLAGGSLIGAMRHKGFIPWDDDMDIMMPYDDFKKFVQVAFSIKHDWLEFRFAGRSSDYNSFILQAQDKRTTLIQGKNSIPMGVFIDIFPYVYCGNTLGGCKIRYYIFKALHNSLLYKTNHYSKSWYKTIVFNVLKLIPAAIFIKFITFLLDYWSKAEKKYTFDPTGNLHGIIPTYIFESGFILTEFEDCMFYRFKDADGYLRCDFGDYMQLPPDEKQIPHHLAYFNPNMSYSEYKASTK